MTISEASAAVKSDPQSPPIQKSEADSSQPEKSDWLESSPGKLLAGLGFGTIFGFLLQKGGVAKFDILMGALLLENFVVVKVMLTAVVVGMAGIYLLQRMGLVERQLSKTVYGANIIGGLIFGVGFGLLAYCPGTNAAALGQGNLDALIGVAGLMFGSYLYALSSRFSSGRLSRWGDRGKLTWPELLSVSQGLFIAIAAPLLIGVLIVLEMFAA